MNSLHSFLPLLVLVALGAIESQATAETLTYPDLVHRLTDLQGLAVSAPAGENTALVSSHDRTSQYDVAQDKYLNWGANEDGNGYERKEGDLTVLADIKGPGCIWRTWSAKPQKGHVKIYLDGDEIPAVDFSFEGYFDRKNEPFTRPNLVYKTTANGFNNYTPIPFQKSCKIVADPDWGSFYHFNYTTFAPGTVVPTFHLPLSAEDSTALDEANRLFGKCGDDPAGDRPGKKIETPVTTVPAGGEETVADLKGPEAITGLRVRFDLPQNIDQQRILLHQLTIRITWDGQKQPAVWAPLGDFFGIGKGAIPHRNFPSGLTEDNLWYSYWYMPFASQATITVGNDSDKPVAMNWEVVHAPLTQPADSLLRFHAKWHRDAFLPTHEDRQPDWTMLVTQGKGRFVGTQLSLWCPGHDWWGEGDEKFFVDGEKFPSTFGTGSEDYFGYAWSSAEPFIEPLHSQPGRAGPNGYGHVSVNRWHIADNIPFQTSFEGCIEKYFANDRPCRYANTVFWYLSPDGKDPYEPVPVAQRLDYWNPPGTPAPAK